MAAVKDVLVRARSLIAAGWCQETFAQNANGEHVGGINPTACKFCLDGALMRADYDLGGPADGCSPYWEAFTFLTNLIDKQTNGQFCGIVRFNDQPGRTQQEVVELLDAAIAAVG